MDLVAISSLSGNQMAALFRTGENITRNFFFILEYSKSMVKTVEDICLLKGHISVSVKGMTMCWTGLLLQGCKPDFAL